MQESPALTADEAARILEWYAAMGVDVALDDEPHDRLAVVAAPPLQTREAAPLTERSPEGEARAQPSFVPPPATPAQQAVLARSQDEQLEAASALASAAKTLDELKEAMQSFEGLGLKRTATQLVFADGTPGARLMLVGEAPGREEDLAGKPFVGRAGQLLDRMLAAIGLDRTGCYIANVIPWRPPGNRTPTPQETQLCLAFVKRQIELADPDVLLLLGATSVQALLPVKDGITRIRGRWFDYDTGRRTIPCLATLHPAYLLRQPLAKRMAWRDFLALRGRLDGQG